MFPIFLRCMQPGHPRRDSWEESCAVVPAWACESAVKGWCSFLNQLISSKCYSQPSTPPPAPYPNRSLFHGL